MVNVYEEEQKFSQWWIYLILGGLFFVTAVSLAEPGSFDLNMGSWIGLALVLALIVLFAALRLKTKISQLEISFHYFPLFRKTVSWDEIDSVQITDYGFVGGWGIRLTKKYGIVYNTKGQHGLLVKLKSGKKFVIGTQQKKEIRAYLGELGKISQEKEVQV